MESIYLDKLLKDTEQILSILDVEVDINQLEQDVDLIIWIICELATTLESFKFPTLEGTSLNANACRDTYRKNPNPMGFLIMLSKLLPALKCPHTILTTGSVKKRLLTKKA